MKKKEKKLYVIWYIPTDGSNNSHGWPTLNIATPKFKTGSEGLKALKQHMVEWPDETVALRIMTKGEYKEAINGR